MSRKNTPPSYTDPGGPRIVDTHSYRLSLFGPALQLGGGSSVISASSFWMRFVDVPSALLIFGFGFGSVFVSSAVAAGAGATVVVAFCATAAAAVAGLAVAVADAAVADRPFELLLRPVPLRLALPAAGVPLPAAAAVLLDPALDDMMMLLLLVWLFGVFFFGGG